MPGTATLDSDALLDDLIPDVVDDLNRLQEEFGLLQFKVFVVTRKWTGGQIGVGRFNDTENEIDPRPYVEPFEAYAYKLEACGLDVAGYVKISGVSLTYTEEELGGKAPPEGTQYLIKIAEGMGQGTSTRYFVHFRPPYPDRKKTAGWLLKLQNAQATEPLPAPEAGAFGDAMSVTPGNALFKDLGNMAAAAANFDYIVPAGKKAFIQRLNFMIKIVGDPADGGFGDQAVLSTGCLIKFLDTDLSTLLDALDGEEIKKNEDWALLAGSQLRYDAAIDVIQVEWTLPAPIELTAAQRFRFTTQQTLVALTEFRCQLQGYLEND